jgi:hypothetical protein
MMKVDAIKQEPKEKVQKYFEHFDKLFHRGRIRMLSREEDFWPY